MQPGCFHPQQLRSPKLRHRLRADSSGPLVRQIQGGSLQLRLQDLRQAIIDRLVIDTSKQISRAHAAKDSRNQHALPCRHVAVDEPGVTTKEHFLQRMCIALHGYRVTMVFQMWNPSLQFRSVLDIKSDNAVAWGLSRSLRSGRSSQRSTSSTVIHRQQRTFRR